MSPVAPSSGHAGKALGIAAVAIVLIMGGLFLAAKVYSLQPSTKLKLGDDTFHAGGAERIAKAIAKGGPILYTDIADTGGEKRDIVLQHLGGDEATGWYAFLAHPKDK